MKLQTLKNGFLGVNQGTNFETGYDEANAIVIPFGVENTVSYGKGTKNGPKAILQASHYMEVLDEEYMSPFHKSGIATLKEPKISKDNKQAVKLLAGMVAQVIADKKFPLVLGGEHSLTLGTIKGLCSKYSDFSILHFDAHSDTRLRYYIGGQYSHGAVMSQILIKYPIAKLVQVGIRSVSDQDGELDLRKQYKNKIKTFWAWEKIKPRDVVNSLPTKNVFISFDVDVFDPSVMPATGTPEPGGLLWWPILDILKAVYKEKNVIGADVVELSPKKEFTFADFTVARLVYKMIGYKFK